MKKVIALVVCLVFAAITISANNSINSIEGLQEKMDNLWLINHFTQEQMNGIVEQLRDGYIEHFWSMPWETRIGYEWRDIQYPDDPEAELAHRLEKFLVEPEKGLRVTQLHYVFKYANQYAQTDNFEYSFDDNTYWSVPRSDTNSSYYFSMEGEQTLGWLWFSDEITGFLEDVDWIADMLNDAGVRKVNDVKLCGLPGFKFLYLNCDKNNYMIRLDVPIIAPDIKGFVLQLEPRCLYTVEETMQIINDTPDNRDNQIIRWVIATKPTFDLEAQALQQAGLLQGNEKGLDLLKPLTRIEATTLLVRALGFENEQTAAESEFVDIPNNHWCVKYVNIASDKGITTGVGDGKFAPNELVTDNQFATLVLRSANEPEFDWQIGIQILIERGIITKEEAETMDLFTRGDMAKIIYEAMEKGLI